MGWLQKIIVTTIMLFISLYTLSSYSTLDLKLPNLNESKNLNIVNKFLKLLELLRNKNGKEELAFKTIAITSGSMVVGELKNLQKSLISGDTVSAKLWGRIVENEAKRAIKEVSNYNITGNKYLKKYVYGLKLAQIAGKKAQLIRSENDILLALDYTNKSLNILESVLSGFTGENLGIIKELTNLSLTVPVIK